MRIGWGASIVLALALAGCASSAGLPATGFVSASIARAYLPLARPASSKPASASRIASGEGQVMSGSSAEASRSA